MNAIWAQVIPPAKAAPAPSPGMSGYMHEPIVFLSFGAIFLLMSLVVAVQARRRGYPLLVWLLAGALGNSIFLLILLGIMPDFRRKNMRKRELDDLEGRLLLASQRLPGVEGINADRQGAMRGSLGRSLDDQVTTDIPQRSLGDDVTRL